MDQLVNVITADIQARAEAIGRARGILRAIESAATRLPAEDLTLEIIRDHATRGLEILEKEPSR